MEKEKSIVLLKTTSLKTLREYRGMKQKDVAKLIGKKQPYISALESGNRRPNIDTFKEFADIYNCEICFLMK